MQKDLKLDVKKNIVSDNLAKEAKINEKSTNSKIIYTSYFILVVKVVIAMTVRILFTVLFGFSPDWHLFKSLFIHMLFLISYFASICWIAFYSKNYQSKEANLLSLWLYSSEFYFYVNSDIDSLSLTAGLCFLVSCCLFAITEKTYPDVSLIFKFQMIVCVYTVGLMFATWETHVVYSVEPTYLNFNKIIGSLFFSLWSLWYINDNKNIKNIEPMNFSCLYFIDSLVVIEYTARTLYSDVKSLIESENDDL